MTRFIRWTLAITFLAAMAVPAFSQSRNTGEIRGTVSAADICRATRMTRACRVL